MLDIASVRKQFPSLSQTQDGKPVVYFDNPGGTQVPRRVIDAMVHYLQRDNANHGGAFPTSRRSDAMLEEAHQAMADMLGAASRNEIVFGPNMTTLAMGLSRALAQWVKPGDEVIVTRLDHDANISPWMLLARDAGASLRWVDFRPEECSLNLDDLERQLSKKTPLGERCAPRIQDDAAQCNLRRSRAAADRWRGSTSRSRAVAVPSCCRVGAVAVRRVGQLSPGLGGCYCLYNYK